MIKKQITVIKRFKPKEVFGQEYRTPTGKVIPECPVFKDGQVLISEDLSKPKEFCGEGWRAIYKDLSVLNFGGNFWHDWTEQGTMYVACPDGIRPVCFKLERVDNK